MAIGAEHLAAWFGHNGLNVSRRMAEPTTLLSYCGGINGDLPFDYCL